MGTRSVVWTSLDFGAMESYRWGCLRLGGQLPGLWVNLLKNS